MGLFIRSQDKESLTDAGPLSYQKKWGSSENTIIRDCGDTEYFLGSYKSKERALQVIDEIQTHITNQENEHNYNASRADLHDYSSTFPVFQMPAE
jgi:hypothetical protein